MRPLHRAADSDDEGHRPRDIQRAHQVHAILEQLGATAQDWNDRPLTHAKTWPSAAYYAVEVTVFADTSDHMPARDALADQIITALRNADYLVHTGPCAPIHEAAYEPEPHHRPTILAYKPEWGAPIPETTLTTAEAARYVGVEPSTLRAYASRGEAPRVDGGRWPVSVVDRFIAERHGKPGRPRAKTEPA